MKKYAKMKIPAMILINSPMLNSEIKRIPLINRSKEYPYSMKVKASAVYRGRGVRRNSPKISGKKIIKQKQV